MIKRLAVAGRYADRAYIRRSIEDAGLETLPVGILASWLTGPARNDADLTDEEAYLQVGTNLSEIIRADALLYFPSWHHWHQLTPVYTPGRLIDFGMAHALGVPIIVVGKPEPTIYQRGRLVTVCTIETLRETVKKVLGV